MNARFYIRINCITTIDGIEYECYDGKAIATDGSGRVLDYPCIEHLTPKQKQRIAAVEKGELPFIFNQSHIARVYGTIGRGYVKTSFMGQKFNLLAETMIMLSADIFKEVYDLDGVCDYNFAASLIREAAIKFEKELDWNDGDEEEGRNYIEELEAFEEKELARLRELYG